MKIIKLLLLVIFAVVFTLVIIPFSITKVFSPEIPPEKKPDKQVTQETVKSTSNIHKEKIPKNMKVFRQAKGITETIRFESYVKGVVSSEMPSDFEIEALKAQAVAARTYSLSKLLRAKESGNPSAHPNAPVCDTVHCQVYQSEKDLQKIKGSSWMKQDWKRICSAVDATKGQLLYYNGTLVEQALFHSSSGGKTENCEDVFSASVPYLVSVSSPYEEDATHKKERLTLTLTTFASKIKSAFPTIQFGTINDSNIKILSHSSGGRVEKMKIGEGTLEGRSVREALGLYSANFKIKISKGRITFISTGSGHGVGMSQYGAEGMAKKGYDYKKILTYYYSGTQVL